MIYLSKIQKAIKFSIKTHEIYQKQKRKGKDVAYITHPLTVGLILAQVGASEDLVVAGILHDTIEDSLDEKKVTVEMLEERFGDKVVEYVLGVTETDKSLSWEERKKQALEDICHFSNDLILLKSADVIANLSEFLDDYARCGDEVFERFNAPKEKTLKHQLAVIEVLSIRWEENPLLPDLRYIADKLQKIE